MATINKQKIVTVASLAGGATHSFEWKNPPWDTMLGYFAYPVPPPVKGPHGAAYASVEITKIECTYVRDNFNGDRKYVTISVQNTGTVTIGFEVWESWIS